MDPATQPTGERPSHSCKAGLWLCQQLSEQRLDAALEAGLMEFVPCPTCAAQVPAAIGEAQQRLNQAWEARDRHIARNARLARQATARTDKRRATPAGGAATLPSAAAAALARARARAKSGEPR